MLQCAGYLQPRTEGNLRRWCAARGYPLLLPASAASAKRGRAKRLGFGEIARFFFQGNVQPGPEVHARRPDPGRRLLQNGWGRVDGDSVEKLNKSTTEKEEILKDSVEALVLKKRIREELQRKDQLVNHKEDDEKNAANTKKQQQKKIEAQAKKMATKEYDATRSKTCRSKSARATEEEQEINPHPRPK